MKEHDRAIKKNNAKELRNMQYLNSTSIPFEGAKRSDEKSQRVSGLLC